MRHLNVRDGYPTLNETRHGGYVCHSNLSAIVTSTMPVLNNTFVRAHIALGCELDPLKGVNSLPELVEFNAKHNPNHLFAIQLRSGEAYSGRKITFAELSLAVERAAGWLIKSGVTTGRTLRTDEISPVAILLGSDIGIFIYIIALMRIGTPASIVIFDGGSCH